MLSLHVTLSSRDEKVKNISKILSKSCDRWNPTIAMLRQLCYRAQLCVCGSVKREYLYVHAGIQLVQKDLKELHQHITEELRYVVSV